MAWPLFYNGNYGSGSDSSQVGYFSRVDDATHYQLNVGTSDKHSSVDGYYSHDGSLAQVDLSANYHEGGLNSIKLLALTGLFRTFCFPA